MLNLANGADTSLADVDDKLTSFLSEAQPTVAPVLQELIVIGWPSERGDRYRLTPRGSARFQEVLGRVSADRQLGPPAASRTTTKPTAAVLERMGATSAGLDEASKALCECSPGAFH